MVAKWMKWNVWNGISKVGHKTVEKFITVEHSNQTSMVSTLATFDQQFVETRNKLRSSILHSDAFHVHNNIIILSTLIYISLCVYKLCKAYWRRLALKSQLKIIETNVMGVDSVVCADARQNFLRTRWTMCGITVHSNDSFKHETYSQIDYIHILLAQQRSVLLLHPPFHFISLVSSINRQTHEMHPII